MANQTSDLRNYNERYSRTTPVKLGDLQGLVLALQAADDYLLWLTRIQGMKLPGAFESVDTIVKQARSIGEAVWKESVSG